MANVRKTWRSPYSLIAFGTGGLAIAFLSIASAARELIAQSGAVVPVAFFPDDSRLALRRAGLDEAALLARRPFSAADLSVARQARALDPLDPMPLIVAGAIANAQGRGQDAVGDFKAARRLDPRAVLARYELITTLAATGGVGEAVDEMVASANLFSDADNAVLPMLATAASDPDYRDRVYAALRTHSWVRDRMLQYVSLNGDKDGLLDSMLQLGVTSATRDTVIGNLARANNVPKAIALWRAAYRPQPRAFAGYVFDGAFQGLRAPASMGWQLHADPSLTIEMGERDRVPDQLQVTAFGTLAAPAVTQLLALSAGSYELSARTSDAPGLGAAGRFVWQVACGNDATPLASLSFNAASRGRSSQATSFTVPPGCTQQALNLSSAPIEGSTTYNIVFDAVSIVRK